MNKKIIRLTESDLHKIVKESVNKVLKEEIDMGQLEPFRNVPPHPSVPNDSEIRKQIRHLRNLIDDYEMQGKDIAPLQKKIATLKNKLINNK